jgi:hypothetical protein
MPETQVDKTVQRLPKAGSAEEEATRGSPRPQQGAQRPGRGREVMERVFLFFQNLIEIMFVCLGIYLFAVMWGLVVATFGLFIFAIGALIVAVLNIPIAAVYWMIHGGM